MNEKKTFFKVISNKDETVKLFNNPILERLTHIHPSAPLFVFVPFIIYLTYTGFIHKGMLSLVGITFGLFIWTFLEYTAHRFAFHYHPSSQFGKNLNFLIHEIHHAYPKDSTRLVMPFAISIPGALFIYFIYELLMGGYATSVCAGTLLGYIIYDTLHFSIHHLNIKNYYFRYVKKIHLNHHYLDDSTGFGVTSPLWDYIFKTNAKDNEKNWKS